jgi:glycosyltransferase involved in cell wall biosynthesis
MRIQRIIVCEAHVPFVRGGAEYLVRTLVDQLLQHGFAAELVSIPFKWYPKREILAHAAAWRLIDLSESNGQPIDLVIASKFPTYFVRHPNKVAWLVHQYRAVYELCGTEFSDFDHTDEDVGTRESIMKADNEMLGECRRVFTISRTISQRLAKDNGLHHDALYPPPPFAERIQPGAYGDYVLFVGRMESIKRPDLVVRAMQHVDRPTRLVMVGEGSYRQSTEQLAESLGLSDRITFAGAVNESALIDLYKDSLAIVFAPFHEDYGYVTLEAFLAHKAVITSPDAGGPLEFVEDGTNGMVIDPEPEAMAAAINRLAADKRLAARLGDAGHERARLVTWDGVIEKLVGLQEPGESSESGSR